jgi:hypothetical protein
MHTDTKVCHFLEKDDGWYFCGRKGEEVWNMDINEPLGPYFEQLGHLHLLLFLHTAECVRKPYGEIEHEIRMSSPSPYFLRDRHTMDAIMMYLPFPKTSPSNKKRVFF